MKKFLCVLLAVVCIVGLASCSKTRKIDTDAAGKVSLISSDVVVADTELYSIKITKAYENVKTDDGETGFSLCATVENKSSDNLEFVLFNSSVNGVLADTPIKTGNDATNFIEVKSGATIENQEFFISDSVYVNDSGSEELKIGKFTEVDVNIEIFKDKKIVAIETAHLTPYGESAVSKFSREAKTDDKVVLDNDYVTVLLVNQKTLDYEDEKNDVDKQEDFTLYVTNKTDKPLWFSGSDFSGEIMVGNGSAFERIDIKYNSEKKPEVFETEYTIQTLDDILTDKVTLEDKITLS